MRSKEIIALHFGWDVKEMREYRYQYGRTGKEAIYAIGDSYFCVQKTKPVFDNLNWRMCLDQFWADRAGTVIWESAMNSSAN